VRWGDYARGARLAHIGSRGASRGKRSAGADGALERLRAETGSGRGGIFGDHDGGALAL